MPKTLEERLEAHPELKAQMEHLLDIAESDIKKADDVELRTVESIKIVGQQVIQQWAEQQAQKTSDAAKDLNGSELTGKGKKKLSWTTTLGEIAVMEQVFKWTAGGTWRPFGESAEISYRGYSLLFQRRITDFGAEKSFGKAARQFKEHYGFDIPESAARRITEAHGEAIDGHPELLQGETSPDAKAQLIGETDGTMVPIVNMDPSQDGDQRKTRAVCWKEARLALVYEQGMVNPIYGATTGSPTQVGEELANCALHVGWGGQTKVHGVGDGASWIANQFEERFGAQGSYLIDLFHLGEYLAAASKSCSCDSDTWYRKMKAHALADQMDTVLNAMKPHIEPKEVDDKNAPVRACDRYIRNRPEQFNYQAALLADLPVGSGKIESAHRYIAQSRLKIPGAWWKIENVDKMLALRVSRANGNWEKYWDSLKPDSYVSAPMN